MEYYTIKDFSICPDTVHKPENNVGRIYSPDIKEYEYPAVEVYKVSQTCTLEKKWIGSDIEVLERERLPLSVTEAKMISNDLCPGTSTPRTVYNSYIPYACDGRIWTTKTTKQVYCVSRDTSLLRVQYLPPRGLDIPTSVCVEEEGYCKTTDQSYLIYTPYDSNMTIWRERYTGPIQVDGTLVTVRNYVSSLILTNMTDGPTWERNSNCWNTTRNWIVCMDKARSRRMKENREDLV
jgi:hypothetical protein